MTSILTLYNELNREQKRAVNSPANTVVIAGPGSGKTRIVSVKAGKLFSEDKGVACISFGNATVDRIRNELRQIGFRESDTLYVGTVHSFCLEHIVHPFGSLVNDNFPQNFGIASETISAQILKPILESHDVSKEPARFLGAELTAYRRSVVQAGRDNVIDENLDSILKEYDKAMFKNGMLDFEMIVEWAVITLRKSRIVRQYLQHQFPYMLIDEYQDLGASLHSLTVLLAENNVIILAVGDPNQLIFEFTGASDEHMQDLVNRGFDLIRTETCYRFGNRMIAASSGALGQPVPYKAWKEVEMQGKIYFSSINGPSRMQAQAEKIVSEIVPSLLEQPDLRDPSDIAILYPWKGEVPDSIRRALLQNGDVNYIDERDAQLPNTPLIKWLRKCADWSLANDVASFNEFPSLSREFLSLLSQAGKRPKEGEEYEVEHFFQSVLLKYARPDMLAEDWMRNVCADLGIELLLRTIQSRAGELIELEALLNGMLKDKTIEEITYSAEKGRIILTTMHSSKGREFNHVILPGIQLGILPWTGNNHEKDPSFRRLFYVACTRAKKSLHIVYSTQVTMTTPWREVQRTPSPFLRDIVRALEDFDARINS